MKKHTYTQSSINVDAINESSGWQQVAPYCEAPYWDESGFLQGVQILNKEIAERLVEKFNSSLKKVKNFFSGANGNIPFYNGHPDHASAEARDMNVYAEADALEAREGGLWAHIVKHDNLEDLKNEFGKREISPRWTCSCEGGNLIPIELISFGLVDKGNLPNADAINAFQQRAYAVADIDSVKELADQLGLDQETATAESIASAVRSLQTSVAELQSGAQNTDAKISDLESQLSAKEEQIVSLSTTIKDLKEALKMRETEFGNEKLDSAFDRGDISIEQKEELAQTFGEDFEGTKKRMEDIISANKASKMKEDEEEMKDGEVEETETVEVEDEDEDEEVEVSAKDEKAVDDSGDDGEEEEPKKKAPKKKAKKKDAKNGAFVSASEKQSLVASNASAKAGGFWEEVEKIQLERKCSRMDAIKWVQLFMNS